MVFLKETKREGGWKEQEATSPAMVAQENGWTVDALPPVEIVRLYGFAWRIVGGSACGSIHAVCRMASTMSISPHFPKIRRTEPGFISAV